MRIVPTLIIAVFFGGLAFLNANASETTTFMEADTYRFGDLYRSERGSTAEACAQMCDGDADCASWSLTPATFRIGPRCELKRTTGRMSHRPGAVSGVSATLQMIPARDAAMLYQPQRPNVSATSTRLYESQQPKVEPELLGGPEAVEPMVVILPNPAAAPVLVTPAPAPQAVQKPVVMVAPTPVPRPKAVQKPVIVVAPTAPAPAPAPAPMVQREPHILYKEPIRLPPPPAPAPTAVTTATVQAASALPNAQPNGALAPAPASPPAPNRVPWTERDGTVPNYSVGSGFIPGDEDATAGFVEGLPEQPTDER